MNLIIVHSTSKNKRSLEIASRIQGNTLRIEHVKKILKLFLFQLITYGYQTVANKHVDIKPMDIDFDQYSDIYLVSPVWAGRVNAYMRQFLIEHPFENKRVHIIGSCEGGYKNYFNSFKKFIEPSNEIVEMSMYVKGQLVSE